MKFQHYKLGYLKAGQIVEVTLKQSAANVRLLDNTNFNNYRSGRQHRYLGGLVKQSPYQIEVPRNATWHLTVDMNGMRGSVRSAVRVLPGMLPPARQQTMPRKTVSPLSEMVHEPIGATLQDGAIVAAPIFDVFISHASEDKDSFVRALATQLSEYDLDVWYDEFSLRIGDSLRRKIDEGITNSRFGIVVLSKSFFAKGWANHELDGLVTKSVSGQQVLLPIWHGVSRAEVAAYSASLADKVARSTSEYSIEEISKEIADVILEAKQSAG